jgi:methylated-DNA-[protein]-cysteine S-methyltransferase
MPQASIHSPVGTISVESDGERLTAIRIGEASVAAEAPSAEPLLREALAQLGAYFDGRLTVFDLPIAAATSPRGPAHRAAIAAIGHGETASYGELARSIGSSPRAVGQACRRNPFPIIIPCHRVLGAAQAIGHYSAGAGIATKRWLLDHEQRGQD